MFLRLIAVMVLVLASGAVRAEDAQPPVLNKPEFVAFKAQLVADIEKGKRYRELSDAELATVQKTLARMEQRWQKADDVAQLNPDQRLELANDQQLLATLLARAAADSRVVCSREAPIGSNMTKTICRTVAQMKRDRENAQSSMRDGKSTTN